jgi:outer membrane receptor protein involved in Fe transport
LLTKALDPIFGPLPVLRNAPRSKVYGAEADLQYAPAFIDGLFLAATVAYTRTEIQEFVGLNSTGDTVDLSGRPFNFAPRLQYTLLANYTVQASDHLNVTCGADWYHSGPTNSTIDQDPRFAFNAYGLIGARIGVASTDGRWSLTAFGRNLSNEFSTVAVFQNGDAVSRVAGATRTYGLTLTHDW